MQVHVGERHVLEHLDVAWGNGVGEEGRGGINKVPEKVPNKGEEAAPY